jgi:hypothetical protein
MAKTSAALSVIPGGAGSPAAPTDDLVDAVQNYIEVKVAPLREKILLQQAEIEALKSRPAPQPGRDGLPGVPGRDGQPGAPGADGLGFDDLTVERDHERRIVFKFTRGDREGVSCRGPCRDLPRRLCRGYGVPTRRHGDLGGSFVALQRADCD